MRYLLSDRMHRLTAEGLLVATGQVLAIVGTLVGVRLLTRHLSPATFGELALGLTAWTLLSQTVTGALASGLARFYPPAVERDELGGYLTAVRVLVGQASAAILAGGTIGVVALVAAGHARWVPLAIGALIYALVAGFASYLNVMQNAARHRGVVAIHQALDAWGRFVFAVGLASTFGPTSTNAMAGYAMGALLTAVSQYLFFRHMVARGAASRAGAAQWRKSLIEYSWPFAAWGLFTWAQMASDRWALEVYSSTEDVGLYSVLYQLGYSPMALATAMVMQFLSPIVFQRAGDASDSRRRAHASRVAYRLTAVTLLITSATFVAGLMFHRQVFQLLATAAYAPVSYLLPWMMLGGGLFAAGQAIALNLLSQMRVREMMTLKIATAAGGTALNCAGAYLFGVTGVVIAGVIFSGTYFVWLLLLSNDAGVSLAGREVSA